MTKETEEEESTKFMNNLDAYYKKTISYGYRGYDMRFRVSQSLFSSHDIDIGTQRLLRTLTPEVFGTSNKVLDLGCGYGPIGISLSLAYKPSIVHMVDRDALALEYTRQNAKLNDVSNLKVYGSLGYDEITETDFDLIVSNIPAKVGELVLSHMLQDARFFLKPEGRVTIVVVDPIADYVTRILNNQSINILFRKSWPGHTVLHYQFSHNVHPKTRPEQTAFESGVYYRGQKVVTIGTSNITIQTTYDLPEFNTLSYETELLLDSLHILGNRNINKAIVLNPGQGFIPVALSKSSKVEQIVLVDRDLQALRISKINLVSNNYPASKVSLLHQVGVSKIGQDRAGRIIGVLLEEDGPVVHAMFVRQAVTQLAPNGLVLLASSSTSITRIESFIRSEKLLDVFERQRNKGKSVIILKHK